MRARRVRTCVGRTHRGFPQLHHQHRARGDAVLPPSLPLLLNSQSRAMLTFETETALPRLPRLPTRNLTAMRSQALLGCCFVGFLIIALSFMTIFIGSDLPMPGRLVPTTAILIQAAIATLLLLGIMIGDPGEVRRTPRNTLPVPAVVADRLAKGHGMDALSNIRDVDGKRSYCVRCFVWRDHVAPISNTQMFCRAIGVGKSDIYRDENGVLVRPTVPHHCSICGRCVLHFDHHCGVFGRCIAGRGLEGNMKYFLSIITMAFTAIATCLVTVACSTIAMNDRNLTAFVLGHL